MVLPPLIYSASVAMSWREFRMNLRPITLLAVGCVIFTAAAVAAATHYFIGLPWAVGFLLGAIVAPPDVVAPLAIARRLGTAAAAAGGARRRRPRQRRHRADPLSLRGRRDRDRHVLAADGGRRVCRASSPARSPSASSSAGSPALRNCARDPQVEITLSLITPYVAYWLPEHLGGSGVIATVACGLYVSWNGPLLISAATRLQGIFFWDLIIYLIEGLLFLLTGFQMRALYREVEGVSAATTS